jgi:hypothetical protein
LGGGGQIRLKVNLSVQLKEISKMAGKPGMTGGGGPRPNSGRPPKKRPDYEKKFKKRILKAARELEKEHGINLEKTMLALCYDANTQDSVKASIFKIYADMFVVKSSRRGAEPEIAHRGPVIGLPPMRPDPAKIVPLEGGKNDPSSDSDATKKNSNPT